MSQLMVESGIVGGEDPSSDFVQLLTNAQLKLLRYVTSLVGDPNTASNILQETNLKLWKKQDEFTLGTNFDAWAASFAYWEVRAYLRDNARDRHVFSEELVSQLVVHRAAEGGDFDQKATALRSCLQKLQSTHRQLIDLRYNEGFSIDMMSAQIGKSHTAIKGALLRARRSLRRCVEKSLAAE